MLQLPMHISWAEQLYMYYLEKPPSMSKESWQRICQGGLTFQLYLYQNQQCWINNYYKILYKIIIILYIKKNSIPSIARHAPTRTPLQDCFQKILPHHGTLKVSGKPPAGPKAAATHWIYWYIWNRVKLLDDNWLVDLGVIFVEQRDRISSVKMQKTTCSSIQKHT